MIEKITQFKCKYGTYTSEADAEHAILCHELSDYLASKIERTPNMGWFVIAQVLVEGGYRKQETK